MLAIGFDALQCNNKPLIGVAFALQGGCKNAKFLVMQYATTSQWISSKLVVDPATQIWAVATGSN